MNENCTDVMHGVVGDVGTPWLSIVACASTWHSRDRRVIKAVQNDPTLTNPIKQRATNTNVEGSVPDGNAVT